MRIYRFTLPQKDNSGQDMTSALKALQETVMREAGGLTMQPDVVGLWRDAAGKLYQDLSWVLDVATDKASAERIMNAVKGLWPDQLSFYVAVVGEAQFVPGLAAAAQLPQSAMLDYVSGGGLEAA